jgi:hypothetical protein
MDRFCISDTAFESPVIRNLGLVNQNDLRACPVENSQIRRGAAPFRKLEKSREPSTLQGARVSNAPAELEQPPSGLVPLCF